MTGMAWLAASAVLAVVPVGVLAVLVLGGALALLPAVATAQREGGRE